MNLKAWRNWPTLLAKHHCSGPNSNVRWLSIANDTETNNSVWQAMLARFARPFGIEYGCPYVAILTLLLYLFNSIFYGFYSITEQNSYSILSSIVLQFKPTGSHISLNSNCFCLFDIYLYIRSINVFNSLKVTRTTFYEISKISHIFSIFRVRVVHILRPHKFFLFVSEKRGSKLWKFMNDFHEVLFKIVCIFFAYWRTALLFNSQKVS